MPKPKCYFSTGICETLTCCKDGDFDFYGYPVNDCPDYPCMYIKRVRLELHRDELKRNLETVEKQLIDLDKEEQDAKTEENMP